MGELALLERYGQAYREIASELVRALPAQWSRAFVLGEIAPDTGQVVGFYIDGDAAAPHWVELPTSMYDAFRRMHDAALASGDPAQRWTSATLALARDGTFRVEYGYDAIDIEDEDERIAAWAKNRTA